MYCKTHHPRPWVGDPSLIGPPLVVWSLFVCKGAIEGFTDVSHAIHTHRVALENIAGGGGSGSNQSAASQAPKDEVADTVTHSVTVSASSPNTAENSIHFWVPLVLCLEQEDVLWISFG